MNNLRRLDLNLLVTLDALLAEHNVTRAAQRLNFSQPAVSMHLAKLRAIFDDPLLLPGPRGMRPTARAEQLREPLRQALAALELAVTPATPFDPAVATDTWRVAAFDYGESTIVLPALNGLRTAAPGTRLAVLEIAPAHLAKRAEQGEIDPGRCIRRCGSARCLANAMCWWAGSATPAACQADASAILPIGAGDGLAGRRRVLWHDRQGVGGRGADAAGGAFRAAFSVRYLGADAVRFGGDAAGAAGAQPAFIATARAAGGAGL